MRTETMTYDNVFAGNVMPIVTETGVVLENQTIEKYSIVELNDDGKVIAPAAVIDESKAYAIATEEVITESGETKPIVLYMTGEFNEDKITFPEGKNFKDYKAALRKLGIFLKPVIRA